LNFQAAIRGVAASAAVAASFGFLQAEAMMDRLAHFERHKRAAMVPVFTESVGTVQGLRVRLVEVGDLLQGPTRHSLPTRATGLVVPVDELDPFEGSRLRHQWPAVYFEARFIGDSVTVAFDDANNRYRVTVDHGTGPVVLVNRPGEYGVRLSGLGYARHDIRVDRISESLSSHGDFRGFFVDVEENVLPLPPTRGRSIEFVGDSDSVGFGNLSERRNCSGEEVFLLTDTQKAFGPQVARHFEADYRLSAISGVGLIRNFGGLEPGRTMLSLHGRSLYDGLEASEATDWAPEIIVIALGSNDFSSELLRSESWADLAELRIDFMKNYVQFVLGLRRRHPAASLILVAWENYGPDYLSAHQRIIEELRGIGEPEPSLLILPPMTRAGCLWHPSLNDHEAVASALIDHIEARPEIWND
jgi:hypothetical protein